MFETASYYFRRSSELGFWGTVHRIWLRGVSESMMLCQSLWWGWMARREMSDVALLSQTTGEWASVETLLEHMASRPTKSFLLPHASQRETAGLLNKYYPDHVSARIALADATCRNEISLLGRIFSYANEIDWQSDPVTHWRWPSLHFTRLNEDLWSPNRQADIRYVWELNRHQHFVNLGIAYWLTGEKRFVDAFSAQLHSWIRTNPLQHGINWCSSMEVSIRLLAWTATFQFFRNSPDFMRKSGKIFLKSLWLQADFLHNHLQNMIKNELPNNHIIGELAGLVIIGAAFPEFSDAAVWRDTGLQLLVQEVTKQTHSDGVNKEQAMGYHRFVAEFLLLIVAHSHHGMLPREPIIEHTLENMLDYVLFSLTPAGTAPMWGDADYGRVLGLGINKNFWDFRPILSAGAVLFKRPDWKFAASEFDDEAFWLLGSDGLNLWKQLDAYAPKQTSRAFADAGLYILRDRWAVDTDVAFFRCGPFGLGGAGRSAHAHSDLLSVILWIRGRPLLVDSGTYAYHGPWRNHFRLTEAHNTVKVDSCEQATPLPYFNWQQTSDAKCVELTGNQVAGSLICSEQVEFTRKLAHPQSGVWELTDKFSGQAESHDVAWFFHFAVGLTLRWVEMSKSVIVEEYGKPCVVVSPPEGIQVEIKSGWVSYAYGNMESNFVLHGIWKGKIPDTSVTFNWKFVGVTENK